MPVGRGRFRGLFDVHSICPSQRHLSRVYVHHGNQLLPLASSIRHLVESFFRSF